jgi:hypothetical protein
MFSTDFNDLRSAIEKTCMDCCTGLLERQEVRTKTENVYA